MTVLQNATRSRSRAVDDAPGTVLGRVRRVPDLPPAGDADLQHFAGAGLQRIRFDPEISDHRPRSVAHVEGSDHRKTRAAVSAPRIGVVKDTAVIDDLSTVADRDGPTGISGAIRRIVPSAVRHFAVNVPTTGVLHGHGLEPFLTPALRGNVVGQYLPVLRPVRLGSEVEDQDAGGIVGSTGPRGNVRDARMIECHGHPTERETPFPAQPIVAGRVRYELTGVVSVDGPAECADHVRFAGYDLQCPRDARSAGVREPGTRPNLQRGQVHDPSVMDTRLVVDHVAHETAWQPQFPGAVPPMDAIDQYRVHVVQIVQGKSGRIGSVGGTRPLMPGGQVHDLHVPTVPAQYVDEELSVFIFHDDGIVITRRMQQFVGQYPRRRIGKLNFTSQFLFDGIVGPDVVESLMLVLRLAV